MAAIVVLAQTPVESEVTESADELIAVRAEVTVTASREEHSVFDEAATVDVIDAEDIAHRQKIANLVDAFSETAGVSVQKTAQMDRPCAKT